MSAEALAAFDEERTGTVSLCRRASDPLVELQPVLWTIACIWS
jgi:hypothetical protein